MNISELIPLICNDIIELYDVDEERQIGIFDLETINEYKDCVKYDVLGITTDFETLVLYVSAN